MRVTISKNGEWHRNVQLSYARGIIEDDLDRFVPVWQLSLNLPMAER